MISKKPTTAKKDTFRIYCAACGRGDREIGPHHGKDCDRHISEVARDAAFEAALKAGATHGNSLDPFEFYYQSSTLGCFVARYDAAKMRLTRWTMYYHVYLPAWAISIEYNNPATPAASAGPGGPAGDAPTCQYHGKMKPSTKFKGWYCSAKMGDGSYCKEQVKSE